MKKSSEDDSDESQTKSLEICSDHSEDTLSIKGALARGCEPDIILIL